SGSRSRSAPGRGPSSPSQGRGSSAPRRPLGTPSGGTRGAPPRRSHPGRIPRPGSKGSARRSEASEPAARPSAAGAGPSPRSPAASRSPCRSPRGRRRDQLLFPLRELLVSVRDAALHPDEPFDRVGEGPLPLGGQLLPLHEGLDLPFGVLQVTGQFEVEPLHPVLVLLDRLLPFVQG